MNNSVKIPVELELKYDPKDSASIQSYVKEVQKAMSAIDTNKTSMREQNMGLWKNETMREASLMMSSIIGKAEAQVEYFEELNQSAKEFASTIASVKGTLGAMEKGKSSGIGKYADVTDEEIQKQRDLLKVTTERYHQTDAEINETVKELSEEYAQLVKIYEAYKLAAKQIDKNGVRHKGSLADRLDAEMAELKAEQESAKVSKERADSSERTATSEKRVADATKKSASQFYYMYRAMKIANEEVTKMANNLGKLYKGLIKTIFNLAKAMLRFALSMKLFAKHTDSAHKAHKGFAGSLKFGFMTVLKYTLGIRSLYVMVNKLRHALGEGMKALATQFAYVNGQMSSIVTSLAMMKVATAEAVQPLLRVLAPAIEKISAAFERATYNIASFFAALTGQTFVYRAIRAQEQYVDTLDETASAAKKARQELRGFDKLNVLRSNQDSGAGAGKEVATVANVAVAAEAAAKKIKDIFSKLFEPIKKAWEKEGKFVMDSWKFALNEVKTLLGDIGRDFLEVWRNDTGVRIWTNILHIIGDVGLIVGFLAQQFDYAWKKNEVGKRILEDIQALIDIIIDGIKRAADATVGWAHNLNFTPLLESIEKWLVSMQPVVQFIVDTLVNFWTKVVLPFKKYMIEEGLPKLFQILTDINNKIDWEYLTQVVEKLWIAFEKLLELGWEVFLVIIEDLGNAFTDLVNSGKLDEIVDAFMDWVENADPVELAKGLEQLITELAGLVICVRVASWILTVVVRSMSFVNVLKQFSQGGGLISGAVKGIGALITKFKGLAGVLGSGSGEAGAAGASAAGGTVLGALGMLAGSILAVTSLSDMWQNGFNGMQEATMLFGLALAGVGAVLVGLPAAAAAAVAGMLAVYGTFLVKVHDKMIETGQKFTEAFEEVISDLREFLNEKFSHAGEWLGEKMGELVVKLGVAIGDAVLDLVHKMKEWIDSYNGDYLQMGIDIVKGIFQIFTLPWRLAMLVFEAVGNFKKSFIEGFKKGFEIGSPSKVMEPYGEYILQGALEGIKNIIQTIKEWIFNNIVTPFMNGIKEKFGITGNSSSVLSEIGGDLMQGLKDGISSKWDALKKSVSDIWQKVTDSAKEKFDSHSPSKVFTNIGGDIMTGMKNGINNGRNSTDTTMRNVAQSIISTAKSTLSPGALSSVGSNLIEGLASGLRSSMQSALSAISSVSHSIISTARSVFQIHSPSKVFMEMGEYITEGLVDGIEEDTSNPFDIMLDNANSSIDAIISRFDDLEARMTQINAIQMLSDNIRVPDIAKGKSLPTSAAFTKVMMSADSLEQTSEIEDDIITVIGLMKRQNTLLEQLLDKDVSINSKDAFNAIRSEANSYFKRTGSAAFAM